MCGRYYVDDDTAKEIEKIVRMIDEKLKKGTEPEVLFQVKDIHPTDRAPVLVQSGGKIRCEIKQWGFPGVQDKQPVIHARCESAAQKKMFCRSLANRRLVIPAAGFYEWNPRKEKNTFRRKESPVLFMAGIYSRYEGEDRFVILTTAANESMKPVHERMPLILEKDEIVPWLTEEGKTEAFLRKTPCCLERETDYEQMTFGFDGMDFHV